MARKRSKSFVIRIKAPRDGQQFTLNSSPISTGRIRLEATVLEDGKEISAHDVQWQLKLSWPVRYDTYQTKLSLKGNPSSAQFETGGILYVRASFSKDGREYSSRVKMQIIGSNPTKEELKKALGTELLKAMAWNESTWQQFDVNGQPKKNPKSTMRGLMQISEYWWGGDRSAVSLNDFNRIAWQWDYNIKAAQQILDYYFARVTKAHPKESETKRWNRTLKAYHAGASTIRTATSAEDYPYVIDIRRHMKNRPWED